LIDTLTGTVALAPIFSVRVSVPISTELLSIEPSDEAKTLTVSEAFSGELPALATSTVTDPCAVDPLTTLGGSVVCATVAERSNAPVNSVRRSNGSTKMIRDTFAAELLGMMFLITNLALPGDGAKRGGMRRSVLNTLLLAINAAASWPATRRVSTHGVA
jgi:hypothetical protein